MMISVLRCYIQNSTHDHIRTSINEIKKYCALPNYKDKDAMIDHLVYYIQIYIDSNSSQCLNVHKANVEQLHALQIAINK